MKLYSHYRRSRSRTFLRLEQLEDRTLLAGNLLITAELPAQPVYNLQEYTQQGALVSSYNVPQAPGATETEDARGLSVDPSGNVNIYDGTLTPSLATFSPATNNWSYQTVSGWSTGNNITYGGVAAYKNYVFASGMETDGVGTDNGIVRFDDAGGPATHFGQGANFLQVSLGLNGQLYGLETNGIVEVFNPDTLAQVGTVALQGGPDSNIRGIAVDGSGQIYAVSWGGYLSTYNANGSYSGNSTQLKTSYGVNENLVSIALDTDGQLAVGGRRGEIYLTNESLAPVQTIQTNEWNVFVTFDHYIGSVPQTVTPTFSGLAGPTITYGQSTVTLGGTIAAGSAYPPGSVAIALDGVIESAAINPADGTFSAVFNTGNLGVSNSPYTLTYSYAGSSNYNAVTDTSHSLTVVPDTTTLSDLSSPTVVVGAATVTLSGTVGSNAVLPVGEEVAVSVVGANGVAISGSGVIGGDGTFQATLNIATLPVGSYTIQYKYAGDSNFDASAGVGTLQITYALKTHFHKPPTVHEGAALPLVLQVTNAAGNNLSSANLTVTAISLVGPNGTIYTPHAKGHGHHSNLFHHTEHGYRYNLDTAGLAPGTYTLYVQVSGDPVLHAISFVVAPPRHWRC